MSLIRTALGVKGIVLKTDYSGKHVFMITRDGAHEQAFNPRDLVELEPEEGFGLLMTAYCLPAVKQSIHTDISNVFKSYYPLPSSEEERALREIIDSNWQLGAISANWNFLNMHIAIGEHIVFKNNGFQTDAEIRKAIDKHFGHKWGKHIAIFWDKFVGSMIVPPLPQHYHRPFELEILLNHPEFLGWFTEVLKKEDDTWKLLDIITGSNALIERIQACKLSDEF